MHHVNQPVGPPYQHASRNQFGSTSGSSGGMATDRASSSTGVMGHSGKGVSVVVRLSPTGVPTYYYYTQQPSTASSSVTVSPSATAPNSRTHSPIPISAPSSPNPSHHRQLPHTPPSHFQYHHQHHHYGSNAPAHSSLPSHYSLQIPTNSTLIQQPHCFVSPPATPSPPRTPPPTHPTLHSALGTPCPPPQISSHRQVTSPQHQPNRYPSRPTHASGTSAVAIDNKIEQAMDLVKSHLMFAVREEVEVLKEKIAELMERINQLELENSILKANASTETLAQLGGGGAGGGGQAVVPPAASIQMQAQGQQQAS